MCTNNKLSDKQRNNLILKLLCGGAHGLGTRLRERLPLPLVLCRENEVHLHLVPVSSIHPPEVSRLPVMASTVWYRHFPLQWYSCLQATHPPRSVEGEAGNEVRELHT